MDTKIHLYLKSMGKIFKVTHVCHSDEEANKICAKNRNIAVIAQDKDHVYLAQCYSSIAKSTEIIDRMEETYT